MKLRSDRPGLPVQYAERQVKRFILSVDQVAEGALVGNVFRPVSQAVDEVVGGGGKGSRGVAYHGSPSSQMNR